MRTFLLHALRRFGQFVLVVFIGINLTFLIIHISPIDPVEASVSAMTAFSSSQPEAVELMRTSLKELYGLQGTLFDQYIVFWKRILVADFGPSLSAFPTPVSTLIGRRLCRRTAGAAACRYRPVLGSRECHRRPCRLLSQQPHLEICRYPLHGP